jgi:PAS domain S-box-containing protein
MSRLFRKTLLIIIVLFGFYANSASIYSAWVLHTRMTAEYRSKAISIARSIASSSAEIFLTRDAATIQSLIDQYTEIEGVYYILVEDSKKDIVSHTFVPEVPEDVHAILAEKLPARTASSILDDATRVTDSKEFIDISVGLIGGLAGNVHVGMDKRRINKLIWDTIIRTQLISFFFFLVTIAITYFLIRGISKPISDLTAYAERVASHDFSASLPVRSKDEIGALANSMRIMSSELKHFISELEADVEKATTELQDALTYQTAIVENLTDGLMVVNESGTIIGANHALLHMVGGSEEQVTGQSWQTCFARGSFKAIGDLAAAWLDVSSDDSRSGKAPSRHPRNVEVIARRIDGSTFPADLSIAVIRLQDQVLKLCVVRDITTQKEMTAALTSAQADLEKRIAERTQELIQSNEQLEREISERLIAENRLAAEKERLTVTMNSIADGVVGTDIDGEITLMNPVAEKILGCRLRRVIGHRFSKCLDANDGQPGKRIENTIGRVLRERRILTSALSFGPGSGDGEIRHIAYSAAPIFDERGNIIGSVVVLRDETATRHLEAQVDKIDKIETLGVLAGGIAHDFNNILNVIMGNIELARLGLNPSDDRDTRLANACTAAARAQELTQQLLTFSKGGAPVKKAASVEKMLKEAVHFALQGSNVKCRFQVPANVWPVEVDIGQINQVINNLTLNASQAMPKGGIVEVKAENTSIANEGHPFLAGGRYLRIEITDHGDGIPLDIREKVTDPYFTTKPRGSGLGLAVVYSIIHRHDGFIDFTSSPGKGTAFFFYLPAAEEPPQETAASADEMHSGEGKVLVMDDELMILEIAAAMLERAGYAVDTASDGEAAVERYRQAMEAGHPYDAIIMDLTIPGRDGWQGGTQGHCEVGHVCQSDCLQRVLERPGDGQPGGFRFCRGRAETLPVENVVRDRQRGGPAREADRGGINLLITPPQLLLGLGVDPCAH